MQFSDTRLYACGPPGGDVAGHVRWDPDRGEIRWRIPGGHERVFLVAELVADDPDRLEFVDTGGRRFVLEPLTLKDYNARVRHDLGPGNPPMSTEEEMLEAFERSLSYPPVVDVALAQGA